MDWLYGTGTRRFGICFNTDDGEGEGGGGAGGGGGDDDLQGKIDDATKGLRKNRDDLKAEKQKLQEQLSETNNLIESLGGEESIRKLVEMRERLSKDEQTKLLSEGKHEEWYENRVASMKKSHEAAMKQLQEQLEQAQAQAEIATRRMTDSLLSSRVAALCTTEGVVETALDDVMRAAREVFQFDPESDLFVMRDDNENVVLGKDGTTPKTLEEWLEEKKEKARHWFPASQGAGAGGGLRGGGSGGPEPDVSGMSMEEYRKYRNDRNMGTGYSHPLNK